MGVWERPYEGQTSEWLTPRYVLDALGPFDLDPCSPADRPWPTAARHITKDDVPDGLTAEWSGRVFLNPPYGPETWRWVRRLAEHGDGVALIFARTEVEGFCRWVWEQADALLFLRGRLNFFDLDGRPGRGNSGNGSVLVAYGQWNVEAVRGCGLRGTYIPLPRVRRGSSGKEEGRLVARNHAAGRKAVLGGAVSSPRREESGSGK